MLTQLFFQGLRSKAASLSHSVRAERRSLHALPALYTGSQTGAFYPQDKSDLRDARTYFRMNRQILTLREVFVGLPSGRKTTYVCAVPAVSETRPATRSGKSRFAIWSWRRDLNPRPSDYKSDALPAELRQRETSRNRAQS
jgi:hypothetical protein